MTEIRKTCAGLGVRFDNFTNERDLMNPQGGEAVSRLTRSSTSCANAT